MTIFHGFYIKYGLKKRELQRPLSPYMTRSWMPQTDQAQLLALWREVGKHRELSASAVIFARALSEHLPLYHLRIDEFDRDRADWSCLCEWSLDGGLRRHPTWRVTDGPRLEAFERWARGKRIAVRTAGRPVTGVLSGVEIFAQAGAAMAGPLLADSRVIGMVVVASADPLPYTPAQQALFNTALEPLAAAVENDLRVREIQRLRAAAEADRQSLLSRLGRDSLSEHIVGAERGLRGVMERVNQVAPTDATVLILGETGSGKEVIARAIHERSTCRDGPFVRVNCGAVPPELIDSELFGHERGSFTGAIAARRGWFERADAGTLFLDEIGELTPAAQVRLLRVLQDRVVQRVGSEQERTVNVRVVAATHRDLPAMVQEGRFREDLWYRLAVFPMILPSLSERAEDIPDLAEHFVRRAAARMGIPVPLLRAQDVHRLQGYHWPGNVREFSAVIERAVILGRDGLLDLQAALGGHGPRSPARVARQPDAASSPDGSPIDPLDQVIKQHLTRALCASRGRVDGPYGAARRLQINVSTLRAKLRKHGLDPGIFRRKDFS